MLDLKWIRENKTEFEDLMSKRGVEVDLNKIIILDKERRQLTKLIQEFQKTKNQKTKQIGSLKSRLSQEFQDLKKDVENINGKLLKLTHLLSGCTELKNFLNMIPNLPAKDVPYGLNESMNKFIRDFKKPVKESFSKEHFDLGQNLGMMDFQQTAKISGSRFVTLKGQLASLERALYNFMIDTHTTDFGFREISPPSLVKPEAMYNTGQLPNLADESYVTSDNKYRLIPTGEVPLTNMVANMVLEKNELPIRYVAYTNCYRSEAGSAGKDTRGMIRNHQFGKVELVSITTPENSESEHQNMLNAAERILQKLDIPYRIMLLCSGDMGFSAKKTYDIEVWLPGQNAYREVSSVSNCGDFQARRMQARYKEINKVKETIFVHTLNGSALAVGRTLVAILENYQNEDGSIRIPKVLIPYMNGQTLVTKNKYL